MKSFTITLCLITITFAGCEYDAPLVSDVTLPIDTKLLGTWEPVSSSKEDTDKANLLVLKFSENEYLVRHPLLETQLYHRAYLMKIGDIPCVQLQLIGNNDGPVQKHENKNLFFVLKYEFKDGILELHKLNNDLVSKKLTSTKELQEAFLKHRDREDLFIKPMKLKRLTGWK